MHPLHFTISYGLLLGFLPVVVHGFRRQITAALLDADFTITVRRYIGHEGDTGYHHCAIDVARQYEIQEE